MLKSLKSFKNLMLHDTPPDNSQFLTHPGSVLKKVLLDSGNNQILITGLGEPGSISRGKSSLSTTASVSSASTTSSGYGSADVIDDGHTLGLGNPKILKLIFRHLSVPDLLTARLVNLRWNVTACAVLRPRLNYVKVPPSQLKTFRKLMAKNITNPISSYAIRIDEVWDKETHKFLARFSPEIFNLRVRLNIPEFTEFAKFLQKMKNLRELHIIVFEDRLNNNNGYLSALLTEKGSSWDVRYFEPKGGWKLGLYKFTKLTKLTFENSNPSYKIHPFYDKIVANIISACGELKEFNFAGWNSPLGRIFLKFDITKPGIVDTLGKGATYEEITNLFFSTDLPFYKIRLEITQQVPFELVSDVIHKCSESLLELTLQNNYIFERFSISSVVCKLARLRLTSWCGPVDFSYFYKQFPALCHLSLNLSNLYEVESGLVDVSKFGPCTVVKTLSLMRLETGIDVHLLEKLSILFPNLKELFVEVRSGSVLEKIYQLYPDLTLLCVEWKNHERGVNQQNLQMMSNQSFTGVPDEMMKIIEERECGCSLVNFPEETRGCWNIGCLKSLTTLLIRVPNSVDNIAMLEGISRLSQLENLVLLPFYSEDEQPIKWCLRAVADSFPRLKTLVTSTEIQYWDTELKYLYSKLPNLVHKRKP